jgi:hypothetical protein
MSVEGHEDLPICKATPARGGHGSGPGAVIQMSLSHSQPALISSLSSSITDVDSQDFGSIGLDSPLRSRQSNKPPLLELAGSYVQAIECTPVKLSVGRATSANAAKTDVIDEETCSKFLIQKPQAIRAENSTGMKGKGSSGDSGGCRSIYETLGWDDYDGSI